MKQFTSLDLQQKSGEIQRSATAAPVVITNHGKPRLVVISVEEFVRLKRAAGEPLPREVFLPHPVEQRALPADPLGRDTRDLPRFLQEMADHALSGRDRDAINREIEGAAVRLGLPRNDANVRA